MNTTTTTDNGLDAQHGLNGRGYDACRETLSPERGLARNLQKMASNAGHSASLISLDELTALLEAQNQAAVNGDLSHVRRLLSNQVTMLERLTDHLFSRAMGMGAVVDVYERYLRLAFRAQAQCIRTAKLLKEMTELAVGEAASKASLPRDRTVTCENRAKEWGQGNGLVRQGVDEATLGCLGTAGKDAHPTLGLEALQTGEG